MSQMGHEIVRYADDMAIILTGKPDAGDPPVRFGGRGGANQCAIPTPYHGATLRGLFRDFPAVGFVRSRESYSPNLSGVGRDARAPSRSKAHTTNPFLTFPKKCFAKIRGIG